MKSYSQIIQELSAFHGNKVVKAVKNAIGSGEHEDQTHPEDFGEKMRHHGVDTSEHELGSGLYGAVYQHPTKKDQVIKIFRKDSAYEAFAKHAKANHAKDPHLPKIHAIHHIGKDIGYVRMEKLQPYTKKDVETKEHPLSGGNIRGRVGYHATVNDRDQDISMENLQHNHPSVHATVKEIAHKFAHKPNFDFDLHKGNMMKRADGTPVVSDPMVSWGRGSSKEKEISAQAKHHIEGTPAAKSSNRHGWEPVSGGLPWHGTDSLVKKMAMKEEIVNTAGAGNIAGIGVGPKGEPGRGGPMIRRSKFAGHDVFEVTSDTFHRARVSKKNWKHWKSYIGEDDTGQAIREYANKNPKASIVLKDERTGAMQFARYGSKRT